MKFIADFHIHSKYSRATSKKMDIEHLSQYARMKGIGLLGTGDFTHHLWLEELKGKLMSTDGGLFKYDDTFFILTTEVCNLFSKRGRGRRIHNIIFAPSFEIVDEINRALAEYGNLSADGRPMLSLEAAELARIVLKISQDCFIVPGHIWTPWYSLFGANSGFDLIEDCFEDQTQNIYALETGLSSDPAMNWRWSALDRFTLISNSDSHSPSKIGREANVLDCKMDYWEIIDVLKNRGKGKFLYTIEFFPQEGKYHYDGHRLCNIRLSPRESISKNNICPVCGRPLTVGVMHRVEELGDRPEGFVLQEGTPFKNLIPLDEIIAEAKGMGVGSQSVEREYRTLIQRFGNELEILLEVSEEELVKAAPAKIAKGISRVRQQKVNIAPGYDGVYGNIQIFSEEDKQGEKQLSFF